MDTGKKAFDGRGALRGASPPERRSRCAGPRRPGACCASPCAPGTARTSTTGWSCSPGRWTSRTRRCTSPPAARRSPPPSAPSWTRATRASPRRWPATGASRPLRLYVLGHTDTVGRRAGQPRALAGTRAQHRHLLAPQGPARAPLRRGLRRGVAAGGAPRTRRTSRQPPRRVHHRRGGPAAAGPTLRPTLAQALSRPHRPEVPPVRPTHPARLRRPRALARRLRPWPASRRCLGRGARADAARRCELVRTVLRGPRPGRSCCKR